MTYNVFDVTLKLTLLIYLAMFRRRMVYVVATRNQRDVEQHQREDLLRLERRCRRRTLMKTIHSGRSVATHVCSVIFDHLVSQLQLFLSF